MKADKQRIFDKVNLRHAVGNAIRQNEFVGNPWRKYRRQKLLPNQSLRVALERPATRETAFEKIHLCGWAASLVDLPVRGYVLVDGRQVSELSLDKPRPDVAKALDLSETESHVGFDEYLPWPASASNPEEVQLSIRIVHGAEELLLGPITVTKTQSPLLIHERGSYKEVWNNASTNHEYAMDSVAGVSDYQEFMGTGEGSAESLKDVLRIGPSDRVLEIGCGTGRIGTFLAKHCGEWVGSDISGSMLGYAKKNLAGIDNARLVELSRSSLSEFEDCSFEKVYCAAVFMHLDPWDRYRYVEEAFRVLKPGGLAYFDNLNLSGDIGWSIFQQTLELDPAERPANISKLSTEDELTTYLTRAGYSEVKSFPGAHIVGVLGKKV